MSTTAILGRYVLARRDGAARVLRDHWVLLEGDRIAAVQPGRPRADLVFDRPDRFVLPGLMNLHNHCFSEAVARTHTEDGNGREGGRSIVYTVLMPLTRRGLEILSAEERMAIARMGILQLLKGGAASVMEPFRNGIPEMFDAAAELGIRFWGAPTHLAQSRAEVETISARHGGRTPAEYLDWLGLLAPDLMAAHCIACTDDDLRLMSARGITVLNCPRVFARAGTAAAFGRFAGAGLRTLVGTDGYNMDLLGELNAASLISKVGACDAAVASSANLGEAVTATAADCVGRPDLGRIEPGAKADLTVVDLSPPMLHPFSDPFRGLVALANRAAVAQVVVDGRVVIDDGRLASGDEQAICAAGSAAVERIWDLPEARRALPR